MQGSPLDLWSDVNGKPAEGKKNKVMEKENKINFTAPLKYETFSTPTSPNRVDSVNSREDPAISEFCNM